MVRYLARRAGASHGSENYLENLASLAMCEEITALGLHGIDR